MTRNSITTDIAYTVPELLPMARSLAWNPIAEDCLFLLTEGPYPSVPAKSKKGRRTPKLRLRFRAKTVTLRVPFAVQTL